MDAVEAETDLERSVGGRIGECLGLRIGLVAKINGGRLLRLSGNLLQTCLAIRPYFEFVL